MSYSLLSLPASPERREWKAEQDNEKDKEYERFMLNGVPGLLRWAEKGDIAGLIAPRPLLVESGSADNCYSRESQLTAYEVVERIYQVARAPDRLDIDRYEGPHQWSGRKAWDWLERWL